MSSCYRSIFFIIYWPDNERSYRLTVDKTQCFQSTINKTGIRDDVEKSTYNSKYLSIYGSLLRCLQNKMVLTVNLIYELAKLNSLELVLDFTAFETRNYFYKHFT